MKTLRLDGQAVGSIVLGLVVAGAAYLAGWDAGVRQGRQHINELIAVGFRVYDPEGFELEAYDCDAPADERWTDSWCARHMGGNGDPKKIRNR